MKKVALLRGINVGGRNKLLMADLKAIFHELACFNIKTYIQSGNVIFQTHKNESNIILAKKVEAKLVNKFNLKIPVFIFDGQEINKAIALNPYLEKGVDIDKLHLTFLQDEPIDENIKKLNILDSKEDTFKLIDKFVFIGNSTKPS